MRVIKKHSKKIFLLVFMCLMFTMQARAQFFGEPDNVDFGEGPGGFDDPPPNDVPLDTYQWIMLILALAYGGYIFWKHYQKSKNAKASKPGGISIPAYPQGQAA